MVEGDARTHRGAWVEVYADGHKVLAGRLGHKTIAIVAGKLGNRASARLTVAALHLTVNMVQMGMILHYLCFV